MCWESIESWHLKRGLESVPYELQAPPGADGEGKVYRATDTRRNRTVAIKMLPRNQKLIDDCDGEIRKSLEQFNPPASQMPPTATATSPSPSHLRPTVSCDRN